jgi:phospholipid-binding lipoprotein MlaA
MQGLPAAWLLAGALSAAQAQKTETPVPAPEQAAGAKMPDVPMRPANAADPWERFNRGVFRFNDAIDNAVLKPVATTYRDVLPQPIRTGVTNFFGNFSDAWSAVNQLLQGKLQPGMEMTMRVATNTVFGLGGLLDIASEAGLEKQSEDFGQTLGRWGLGPGPYIVLPLFGSSTLRDTAALPLDRYVSAENVFEATQDRVPASLLGLVNTRANLLGASRMLDDIALDRYQFVRDAYLSRRQSQVYDGNPPERSGEEDDGAPPDEAPPK